MHKQSSIRSVVSNALPLDATVILFIRTLNRVCDKQMQIHLMKCDNQINRQTCAYTCVYLIFSYEIHGFTHLPVATRIALYSQWVGCTVFGIRKRLYQDHGC